MEKHKKCKMCCSDAKYVWKGSYYCRVCLRAELEVFEQDMPRICWMCGDPLDDKYYADTNGDPFCSVKCAFKYNDVCELEDNDNESRD